MLGRVGGVNGSERVIGYRPNAVERHWRGRGYCIIYIEGVELKEARTVTGR